MEDSMIETVAKAICGANGWEPSLPSDLDRKAARAALEAMRDYTPAMSEAGYEAAANHAATTGRAAYQGDIEVGYLAYIDAALSDQPRPTEEKA